MTDPKPIKLPPRKKLYGIDHKKSVQYRMTGKEWHQYARREHFKSTRGSDYAWGNSCEIWFDGKPLIDPNFPFAPGHEPR
jgi:hypothetical protein